MGNHNARTPYSHFLLWPWHRNNPLRPTKKNGFFQSLIRGMCAECLERNYSFSPYSNAFSWRDGDHEAPMEYSLNCSCYRAPFNLFYSNSCRHPPTFLPTFFCAFCVCLETIHSIESSLNVIQFPNRFKWNSLFSLPWRVLRRFINCLLLTWNWLALGMQTKSKFKLSLTRAHIRQVCGTWKYATAAENKYFKLH